MNYTKQLEEIKTIDNQEQEKSLALAIHLQLEPEPDQTLEDFLSQIVSIDHASELFEADGGEYLVLTDNEAGEKWEESLDIYIDECILPELPDAYLYHFDDEKWKKDARHDGRGHSLNHYDGSEEEQEINGTVYYIYRTN